MILLLERRIAEISSHQKFQSSRTAKICSRKPQKIANPQNKTPAKFSCYTVLVELTNDHVISDYATIQTRCFSLLSSIGSSSNDDGDGNENGKKAIGLWSKTTLHVHHAFLYTSTSLPSLHDYDVKLPDFTFYWGREDKTTIFLVFFFLELRHSSLEFNSWQNHHHLTN